MLFEVHKNKHRYIYYLRNMKIKLVKYEFYLKPAYLHIKTDELNNNKYHL